MIRSITAAAPKKANKLMVIEFSEVTPREKPARIKRDTIKEEPEEIPKI
jgi:hypothetical protein